MAKISDNDGGGGNSAVRAGEARVHQSLESHEGWAFVHKPGMAPYIFLLPESMQREYWEMIILLLVLLQVSA